MQAPASPGQTEPVPSAAPSPPPKTTRHKDGLVRRQALVRRISAAQCHTWATLRRMGRHERGRASTESPMTETNGRGVGLLRTTLGVKMHIYITPRGHVLIIMTNICRALSHSGVLCSASIPTCSLHAEGASAPWIQLSLPTTASREQRLTPGTARRHASIVSPTIILSQRCVCRGHGL